MYEENIMMSQYIEKYYADNTDEEKKEHLEYIKEQRYIYI